MSPTRHHTICPLKRWLSNSAVNAEPGAILLADERLGFGRVTGLHFAGIPLDSLLQTAGEIADEERFRKRAGIGEPGFGIIGTLVFARLDPFLAMPNGTWNCFGRRFETFAEGLGKKF